MTVSLTLRQLHEVTPKNVGKIDLYQNTTKHNKERNVRIIFGIDCRLSQHNNINYSDVSESAICFIGGQQKTSRVMSYSQLYHDAMRVSATIIALNLFWETENIIGFSIISLQWDDADSWNPLSRKTWNFMVGNALLTWGARASSAMLLTGFNKTFSISALEVLMKYHLTWYDLTVIVW